MAFERTQQINTILKKYADYKAANNKPPASLDDLELPENCKKYVNSKGEKVDWIYIGHLGARLRSENSHVVLATPEPLGDVRLCGMDNGTIARFRNGSIQEPLEKLAGAKKGGSINTGATTATSPALAAVMKKIALFKDLNNEKLPESLSDLELDDAHRNYTDPATGEKNPWIYLGNKSKFKVKDAKVIILAPKGHKGRRLAGLSNGKIVALNDKAITPHLK